MKTQGGMMKVTVRSILPLGLLVDIEDGRVGIIRERELFWERDKRRQWRNNFNQGDELQAIVIGGGHTHRLELSLRQAKHDPWDNLTERLQTRQLVDGVVAGVRSYGVFVEIAPGVTGLLHRDQLPAWVKWDSVDLFWPGDNIRVVIDKIDLEQRQVSLDFSRAWRHRWDLTEELQTLQISQKAVDYKQDARDTEIDFLTRSLPQARQKSRSILVVEDDESQRQVVASWLQQAGQRVMTAVSAEDALALLEDEQPDIVLMDVGLPDMDGIQAIRQIRVHHPEVRCMIMTDWATVDARLPDVEALRVEGVSLLNKPLLPEDLLDVLLDKEEAEASEQGVELSAVDSP